MLISNKSKYQVVIAKDDKNNLFLSTEKILTEFTKSQALKFAKEINNLYE